MPGDEPVEQHADRGEVLLDGRGAVAAAENLDIGGDVMRAHRRKRRDALGIEPGEERAHGDGVGGAGVGLRMLAVNAMLLNETGREPQRALRSPDGK